eukprot:scaffold96031_cov27-Tisochrysis_lutea.AAC.1
MLAQCNAAYRIGPPICQLAGTAWGAGCLLFDGTAPRIWIVLPARRHVELRLAVAAPLRVTHATRVAADRELRRVTQLLDAVAGALQVDVRDKAEAARLTTFPTHHARLLHLAVPREGLE